MYLTVLEYLLVRVAFGAVVLVYRAAGLFVLAVLWLLGVVARLVLRPLSRELARAIGRLVGHARVVAWRRTAPPAAVRGGRV